MFGDHHTLVNELPDYKDAIHALKTTNAHFRKLFDAYHDADKKVLRMEEGIETVSDIVLEDGKKQRLSLKDELFAMLKKNATSAN
ncbi:DUF465 domain-containing protein [Alphaproteobacteria bacterium]|nr:DUF465 domain-containing protein [Alphaproteobacteria bacterium]